MKRLKVLLSAYACEPEKGSEPSIGWNMAIHMAKYHDIWIVTRTNNRHQIESELSRNPIKGLHFIYYDLPKWLRFFKRGQKGIRIYYYFWQIGAIIVVRRLHRAVSFDLGHHVTFVKYWSPSFFGLLDIPFVWGPVGGGESIPFFFLRNLGFRGILYEIMRYISRAFCELDPMVYLTARRASVSLATTCETAVRISKLRSKKVDVLTQVALSEHELNNMMTISHTETSQFIFLSIGRLLAWKGFHLGMKAFMASRLKNAEYWIIGDGPEFNRLKTLSRRLEITNRILFWGNQPRKRVFELLKRAHVLVHPSLHESGGFVSVEAMAMERPVICIDIGGLSLQVTEKTGIKIRPESYDQVITDMSLAMRKLAGDLELCKAMGKAARERVEEHFCWDKKAKLINEIYQNCTK